MQLATPVTQEALPELLKRIQEGTTILWNDNHMEPIEILSHPRSKQIAFLLFSPPVMEPEPPMGLDFCRATSEQWLKDQRYEFVDNDEFFDRICSTVTLS